MHFLARKILNQVKIIHLVAAISLMIPGPAFAELITKTWTVSKQKNNPLSSYRSCKKFFPEAYDRLDKKCDPGDLYLYFKDKKIDQEIAVKKDSSCSSARKNDAELYFLIIKNPYAKKPYYVKELGNNILMTPSPYFEVEVTKNEFCDFLVDYNKACNGCLN